MIADFGAVSFSYGVFPQNNPPAISFFSFFMKGRVDEHAVTFVQNLGL